MPNDTDFDKLLKDTPEPSSLQLGFDWHTKMIIESSSNPNFSMGQQRIGMDNSEIHGKLKVDGADSIQKNIAGPLVEHDAPTGIIPSTLFTPFPRDILGIDVEYMELLSLAAMAALFGAVTIGLLSDAE